MTTATTGIGLKRLQHLVLWVSNVERSVRFYTGVLGFEVKTRYPNAAFLRIPGTSDDHHLGLFEQTGVARPDERVARMYHSAWEVGELTDLARARQRRLVEPRRESLPLREGPRRPRVRDLLDRARRRFDQDDRARSRRRARATRP